MEFYNHTRPHYAHGGKPPAVVYWQASIKTNPISRCRKSSARWVIH